MITNEWKKCFKIKPAFVRLVKGDKEEVNTREGITHAFAETDYVMCGEDEMGNPNSEDLYPIKHSTFENTYRIEEIQSDWTVIQNEDSELLCRHTGKSAKLLISLNRRFMISDVGILSKIEDFIFNPQRHQTMLGVLNDRHDELGTWDIGEITCTSCDESMSSNAALSHLLSREQYDKYKETVGVD